MAPVIQIVVTRGSGDGRAIARADELRDAFVRHGDDVKLRCFDSLATLDRWARTCRRTFSHLVAVGGDTTLSTTARAAMRHATPLIPVPMGFGNLFGRALGFDRRIDIIDLVRRGEAAWVDAGLAGREMFLSHRSYGIFERVQHTVESTGAQPGPRWWRHLAYCASGARAFLTGPLPSIRVEIDGVTITEDAAVVTVANVETYRGFLTLAPLPPSFS